jgi:predicted MFS family arabinose efflux permease
MIREAAVGLLVSAFTIPYGLLQLVYGPIADKFGKLQTISVALFLFSFAELACSYADSFTSLLVFRIISGTFAAGIIPVSLAQIGDSFTFEERPKAISFFMSLSMSGQALGIVIGSMLAHFFSWKFIFLSIGLAGILVGLAFLRQKSRMVHIAPKEQIPLKERHKRIFSSRRSRTVYLAVGLEGVILFGGFTYLGVYGNKVLGLDYFSVGLLTAGFSIAAFIGSHFISSIISQVGQHRMPLIGASLLTCAFGLIWLIPHWVALLAGFLLLGLGFIVLHTTLQTYATELLPEARSTCMSLFAFFLFLGNGIGPACLGWVYEAGGAQGMLATTTVSLLVYTIYCKLAFRQFSGSSIVKG